MTERRRRIVLAGPPGCGKGTQAKRLAIHYGLPHVSSGDVLRAEVTRGSDLGQRIREFMDRGEIGPVELITDAVLAFLDERAPDGYILDGFPRTRYQAERLQDRRAPQVAILIEVPDAIIVDRITGRRICSSCGAIFHVSATPPRATDVCDACSGPLMQRSDDNAATVINRLRVYREDTRPVIDYYAAAGILTPLDGDRSADDLNRSIMEIIGR